MLHARTQKSFFMLKTEISDGDERPVISDKWIKSLEKGKVSFGENKFF